MVPIIMVIPRCSMAPGGSQSIKAIPIIAFGIRVICTPAITLLLLNRDIIKSKKRMPEDMRFYLVILFDQLFFE
ncbi:hypothetical protein ABE29_04800 [Cytobacillus firmus]|nr:hypothetical protein [Cytobacillus firmus]MBG9547180.1 hypothetical protein [Cytobacillus firmus]MBG9553819.1 hypothetical protein [Cytobacillus firmus]MBG9557601.1 hypothetical protein [Cytobacillus firmus]MBG9573817.1 hypothetical protein [Cytobacillus firmus]